MWFQGDSNTNHTGKTFLVFLWGFFHSAQMPACVFVLRGGRGVWSFYELVYVCVCVCQDNRWKACSLALSSGTCAVSITPRDPLMIGSWGLLEKLLPCHNGWQSRRIDGPQLSPIIATTGLSKREEGREGGQRCGAVTEGEGSLL